jgi:membrane protease YdiL (CAAX protease family)
MSQPPDFRRRTNTSPGEAAGVVAICFGWMMWNSSAVAIDGWSASNLQAEGSFDSARLYGLAMTELALAALALAWLRVRGFNLRSLLPAPSVRGCLVGLALYLATVAASALALSPFTAAAVQQQPIARMVLESTVSLPAAAVVALVNGTYEEVFLLGFLTRGLRGHGLGLAVGASLAVRVLCHTYQGPLGLLSVLAFALIVTAYFVQTGRLWPAVVCHMAADFVPLAT